MRERRGGGTPHAAGSARAPPPFSRFHRVRSRILGAGGGRGAGDGRVFANRDGSRRQRGGGAALEHEATAAVQHEARRTRPAAEAMRWAPPGGQNAAHMLPVDMGTLSVPKHSGRGRKPKYAHPSRAPVDYHELVSEIETLCTDAYEPASQRVVMSARRCFDAFRLEYQTDRPRMFMQPDFAATGLSMQASLHNEISLMMWAAWMLRIGLASSTASTYLSLARTSMETTLGYRLTNVGQAVRLPRVMRRLRKMYKCVRRKRLGWRAHHARLLRRERGAASTPADKTVHAVLSVAREGLARCCELGPSTVHGFDKAKHPTLRDLTLHSEPQPHLILSLLPAKKAPGSRPKVPVPLPQATGAEIGAFSAVTAMLEARFGELTWGDDGHLCGVDLDASLFELDGQPVTSGRMVDMFVHAAREIGIDGQVSGHSGRIGGATDHFAQATPPSILQICGRWDSDLWMIYTRQCVDQTIQYTIRATQCADASMEEIFDDYTQPAVVMHTCD